MHSNRTVAMLWQPSGCVKCLCRGLIVRGLEVPAGSARLDGGDLDMPTGPPWSRQRLRAFHRGVRNARRVTCRSGASHEDRGASFDRRCDAPPAGTSEPRSVGLQRYSARACGGRSRRSRCSAEPVRCSLAAHPIPAWRRQPLRCARLWSRSAVPRGAQGLAPGSSRPPIDAVGRYQRAAATATPPRGGPDAVAALTAVHLGGLPRLAAR